nr:MAG TPA: DNA-damage-inducible protein D [Caudoviricetes sp.]
MGTVSVATRAVKDHKLARHACCFKAQNGNASKPKIASVQAHFAAQTLRRSAPRRVRPHASSTKKATSRSQSL